MLFCCEDVDEPVALLGGEPTGVGWAVGEPEPADHSEQNGRQSDADHHEPPAGQPEHPVPGLNQPRRQRCSECGGDGDRQHEDPDDARAVGRGEPAAQIEDNAGKKACFGESEQKAQCQQGVDIRCEADRHRDDSPRHRDPGQPAPRPEAHQGEVGRDLDQHVADEEDARRQTEHRRRHLKIGAHFGFGDAEIGAVEVIDEVQRHQQRHQPHRHPSQGRRLQCVTRQRDGHRASR